MKQYIIDELRPADYQKIKAYLDEILGSPKLGNLYWIFINPAILNTVQLSHVECQPFYFALELKQDQIVCELLVRTKNRIRCDCIGYPDEKQRNWLINFIDDILNKLNISV